MNDTNQLPPLPEPDLGYIETDKSRQPAFSARQMREALAQQEQEREPGPLDEASRIVSASAHKSANDDNWRKLFWALAKELNCLPSSFVDGNEHVLRKAQELQARAAKK